MSDDGKALAGENAAMASSRWTCGLCQQLVMAREWHSCEGMQSKQGVAKESER